MMAILIVSFNLIIKKILMNVKALISHENLINLISFFINFN
jgi:hypothetical protein